MYAVLHPPNFVAQVAAQQRPELRKRAFALVDGEPPAEVVVAANKVAHRAKMDKAGVIRAADLKDVPDGTFVRIAGAVIARQRPGTAGGFIFISGEDETGISNAIIHPKVYERNQMAVTGGQFLMIEGLLQNQDSVVSVKASSVRVLDFGPIDMRSHDFH